VLGVIDADAGHAQGFALRVVGYISKCAYPSHIPIWQDNPVLIVKRLFITNGFIDFGLCNKQILRVQNAAPGVECGLILNRVQTEQAEKFR